MITQPRFDVRIVDAAQPRDNPTCEQIALSRGAAFKAGLVSLLGKARQICRCSCRARGRILVKEAEINEERERYEQGPVRWQLDSAKLDIVVINV